MTKLVEESQGTATFELGISLQMWLDLYTEPIKNDPSTYEDENKRYTFDHATLAELTARARNKADQLQHDAFTCRGYEVSGLTYREVTIVTGSSASSVQFHSDNAYTASEDLQFLFDSMHELWNFIFEVECVIL